MSDDLLIQQLLAELRDLKALAQSRAEDIDVLKDLVLDLSAKLTTSTDMLARVLALWKADEPRDAGQ